MTLYANATIQLEEAKCGDGPGSQHGRRPPTHSHELDDRFLIIVLNTIAVRTGDAMNARSIYHGYREFVARSFARTAVMT